MLTSDFINVLRKNGICYRFEEFTVDKDWTTVMDNATLGDVALLYDLSSAYRMLSCLRLNTEIGVLRVIVRELIYPRLLEVCEDRGNPELAVEGLQIIKEWLDVGKPDVYKATNLLKDKLKASKKRMVRYPLDVRLKQGGDNMVTNLVTVVLDTLHEHPGGRLRIASLLHAVLIALRSYPRHDSSRELQRFLSVFPNSLEIQVEVP